MRVSLVVVVEPARQLIDDSAGVGFVADAGVASLQRPYERLGQPLNLQLLGLHLVVAGKGLTRIPGKLPNPTGKTVQCTSRSRAACATFTPRSRTNFTASSLKSRLNLRRSIFVLQFQKHLNLVSMKPAAAHALGDELKYRNGLEDLLIRPIYRPLRPQAILLRQHFGHDIALRKAMIEHRFDHNLRD